MQQNDKLKKLQTFAEDPSLAQFDATQEIIEKLSETGEGIKELARVIQEIKTIEIPTSLVIDGGALKGDKGDSPTEEELVSLITPLIPEPLKGDIGVPFTYKDFTTSQLEGLKVKGDKGDNGDNGERGFTGNEGSPDSPKEIKDKLESLKGDERLDISTIKGAETLSLKKDVERAIDILDQRSQFLINKTTSSSGSGTVTSVSVVTANGLSGSVATATTTPAITLDISALDASKIANGSVSSTEFQYLNGVTSSIQDQIDAITTADITRVVASVSTNTNAGAGATTDYIYLVSGTTTITMPSPTGNTNLYTIKRVGTNTVTVSPNGSETFDGASSISILTRYDSFDLISDETNWNIV